jgi:protein-S-isoprenylcysteine O-methyltransferase Ste14
MNFVLPILTGWLIVDLAFDWKPHKLLVLFTAICWLVMGYFWRLKARGTKSVEAITRIPLWRKVRASLRSEGFYYLPLSSVPILGLKIVPEQIAWLGLAMCVLGVSFAIWSRHTLAANWNISATGMEAYQTLIQTGPYAIVRHPIYLGMLLATLGTALTIGELRAFFNLFGLIPEAWKKLNQEEGILQKQFPDKYLNYQHRVKKLIPGIL